MRIDAKRIWLISDTHLGVRSNSREWMDIIDDYFNNFFIPLLREKYQPGDILVHCGDVFDSRQSINLYVMNRGIDIFEQISKIMPIYMIVGNHDIFMKYSNDIHSLKVFKHIDNITVFTEPQLVTLGNRKGLFLPWVDKHDEFIQIIKNNPADLLFCHTDIKGMSFNKFVKIEEGAEADEISGFSRVYSGHIHYAQKYKNARMLGSPYELTRSDSGNPKHVWLLDLETDEEYSFQNVISPKFLRYQLNWILEQPVGELQKLFENNFVDLMISPQWSMKFPFSLFADKIKNYRKINPIITEDTAVMTEDGELIEEYEDINLISLIEKHIRDLPYSENIKEKLKSTSVSLYYEMIKELEEKKSYETA